MQVSSISRAALTVLLSGALACSADRIQSPSGPALSAGPASLGVVDQNSPPGRADDRDEGRGRASTYKWIVAGDVTQASNGDQIKLTGTGTLGIHPKSATGGGTFVSAAGVIGSGSFIVTELLSFQSYGPGTLPGLPPGSESGKARFRVQLTPTGGRDGDDRGDEADRQVLEGILVVYCHIPGTTVPPGTEEGFHLVVPEVDNFNHQVSGNTLFIKTS